MRRRGWMSFARIQLSLNPKITRCVIFLAGVFGGKPVASWLPCYDRSLYEWHEFLWVFCKNIMSDKYQQERRASNLCRSLVATAIINVPFPSNGRDTETMQSPTGILPRDFVEFVSKQTRKLSSECKTIKFAPGTIATIWLSEWQDITLTAPMTSGACRFQLLSKAQA